MGESHVLLDEREADPKWVTKRIWEVVGIINYHTNPAIKARVQAHARATEERQRLNDPVKFKAAACAKTKRWQLKNPDKVKANKVRNRDRERVRARGEKAKAKRLAWVEANRRRITNYTLTRLKSDIQFRLRHNIRSRVYQFVKSQKMKKPAGFSTYIGCSLAELQAHLESLFKPGMTWENYGTGGWEIDHIRPLIDFDLQQKEEFLKASNYKNLQPMWAGLNQSKNRREKPHPDYPDPSLKFTKCV